MSAEEWLKIDNSATSQKFYAVEVTIRCIISASGNGIKFGD
jgi:hypothetical protein